MGTDCAPVKGLICKDLAAARKFSKTFRYIHVDDLLVLHVNNPHFVKSIVKICPPQLELKRTAEGPNTCSYLDLNTCVSLYRAIGSTLT